MRLSGNPTQCLFGFQDFGSAGPETAGDHFGNSVAVSGSTAVIGAYRKNGDNGTESGSATYCSYIASTAVALLPYSGEDAYCSFREFPIREPGKRSAGTMPAGGQKWGASLYQGSD